LPLLVGIYTHAMDGEEQFMSHLHCILRATVFISQRKAALLRPHHLSADCPVSHNNTACVTS
jgi:hypothetical protein